MSVPQNLSAFDGKVDDYEWGRVAEPPPLRPQTMQPTETTFYCRDEKGQLVEAGLYFQRRFDALMADPAWHAENERKAAEKADRKRAREARLAELRQRKEQR